MFPKLSRKDAKRLFAAHVFLYTSRDGMVISNIINVSPYTLHKLSQSPKWKESLSFWNYKGDGIIQGELYREEVGQKKAYYNLKNAKKLWLELFGLKPVKYLSKILNKD